MSYSNIYLANLNDLINFGISTPFCTDVNSIGTYFGIKERYTKEICGKQFKLYNSRERILISNSLPINYVYLLANLLYLISGDKRIELIQFYNSFGKLFSDDGNNLNASFGYRIFEFNQLQYVIETLQKDNSSRRAVIQIGSSRDAIIETRDFPCLNYVQFMVRNSKLIMIVNMRSQSAYKILPYDVFIFTMLHEIIALNLDIELGETMYFCGSFHIYNDEFEKVNTILSNEIDSFKMQKMDRFTEKDRKNLIKSERDMRYRITSNTFNLKNFDNYELTDYWKRYLVCLFHCYRNPENAIHYIKNLLSDESTLSISQFNTDIADIKIKTTHPI